MNNMITLYGYRPTVCDNIYQQQKNLYMDMLPVILYIDKTWHFFHMLCWPHGDYVSPLHKNLTCIGPILPSYGCVAA